MHPYKYAEMLHHSLLVKAAYSLLLVSNPLNWDNRLTITKESIFQKSTISMTLEARQIHSIIYRFYFQNKLKTVQKSMEFRTRVKTLKKTITLLLESALWWITCHLKSYSQLLIQSTLWKAWILLKWPHLMLVARKRISEWWTSQTLDRVQLIP